MIHDGRRIHLRAGLIAAPIRLRYKGSSGSNTVEQQSGPPQQVLNNYQNAYNTAQNVADNPSSGQSYSGATVAGFTPMQDAGFNAINTAANAGQPFLNAASQDVTNSQTPLLTPGLENQINANSGSTVANAANAWDSGIASSATGYAGGIKMRPVMRGFGYNECGEHSVPGLTPTVGKPLHPAGCRRDGSAVQQSECHSTDPACWQRRLGRGIRWRSAGRSAIGPCRATASPGSAGYRRAGEPRLPDRAWRSAATGRPSDTGRNCCWSIGVEWC